MNDIEYEKKKFEFEIEFIDKFYNPKTTENEKIILVLKRCDINIHPYSLNGRSGFKKYIRKAIKILKEVLE